MGWAGAPSHRATEQMSGGTERGDKYFKSCRSKSPVTCIDKVLTSCEEGEISVYVVKKGFEEVGEWKASRDDNINLTECFSYVQCYLKIFSGIKILQTVT